MISDNEKNIMQIFHGIRQWQHMWNLYDDRKTSVKPPSVDILIHKFNNQYDSVRS